MPNLNTERSRERLTGWFLIAPALLLLLLVFAYPIGRAFWLSLFTKNLGTNLQPVFAGAGNYSRMMGDGRFWQSIWNTTFFTAIAVSIEMILGMGVALVLNQTFRGRGLARTIAILPWALPTALIGLTWTWIFNDQYGVLNDMLLRLPILEWLEQLRSGTLSLPRFLRWFPILLRWIFPNSIPVPPFNWLGDPTLAMFATIAADIWKTTSFVAILLLAGLQSIPEDLYEAHAIDGATPFQSFRQITLPLLMPQILIAVLFRFAQSFGVFDLIKVMTEGGPAGATEMVSIYIYATVMRYLDFGYGAALVVVTFLVLIVAVAIATFLLSKLRTHISGAQ
ncbi:sugar ABC transporter permease [Acaryochloris sp. IP29b_bin.137]|uniref:carbohydrate ABC transporter permease n=1 Tax=Acaryochloris sp. IP29b_bin.137 TaxID=2969217 RepID=UPI00261B567B|nr:sugar ABC transporter permease [Acaryochloris sp. IP29b_bin.137]